MAGRRRSERVRFNADLRTVLGVDVVFARRGGELIAEDEAVLVKLELEGDPRRARPRTSSSHFNRTILLDFKRAPGALRFRAANVR